jgi:hypothetical protein
MSRRRAPVVGREENEMTYKVISATKRYLLRCALGAFALGLAGQSLTGLAAPAISRADEPCAPGWVWSPDLNQCVSWLPTANGPGGPGGAGRSRWPRPALEVLRRGNWAA